MSSVITTREPVCGDQPLEGGVSFVKFSIIISTVCLLFVHLLCDCVNFLYISISGYVSSLTALIV